MTNHVERNRVKHHPEYGLPEVPTDSLDPQDLNAWMPPCPDGNPQRVRRPLGFWERNGCELELRVAFTEAEHGACRVAVQEVADEVHVRVFVCRRPDHPEGSSSNDRSIELPVRVWLDEPLGERAVIDYDSEEELPIFVPLYLDNVVQPDHGYYPANRRGRSARPGYTYRGVS